MVFNLIHPYYSWGFPRKTHNHFDVILTFIWLFIILGHLDFLFYLIEIDWNWRLLAIWVTSNGDEVSNIWQPCAHGSLLLRSFAAMVSVSCPKISTVIRRYQSHRCFICNWIAMKTRAISNIADNSYYYLRFPNSSARMPQYFRVSMGKHNLLDNAHIHTVLYTVICARGNTSFYPHFHRQHTRRRLGNCADTWATAMGASVSFATIALCALSRVNSSVFPKIAYVLQVNIGSTLAVAVMPVACTSTESILISTIQGTLVRYVYFYVMYFVCMCDRNCYDDENTIFTGELNFLEWTSNHSWTMFY